MSNKNTIQRFLDSLSDIGSEKEDILHTMDDNAHHTIDWIRDCLLRQYIRDIGNKRPDVKTRQLIKAHSYNTYISFSKSLHRKLKKAANDIVSNTDTP